LPQISCRLSSRTKIRNSIIEEALLLGCGDIQLSLSDFIRISVQKDNSQSTPSPGTKILTSGCRVGVSIHSLAEAKEAADQGANRLIAGHIFKTDSKAGIAPMGTEYLAEICRSVDIPVVGIGGDYSRSYHRLCASVLRGVHRCDCRKTERIRRKKYRDVEFTLGTYTPKQNPPKRKVSGDSLSRGNKM
jgi:hypothetical protein